MAPQNCTELKSSSSSLLQLFTTQATKTPNNKAIIDTASLKSVTYQRLYESARRLSSVIKVETRAQSQHENNEFVAILLPGSEQLVRSTLAVWMAGKIPVPLNIDYPVAQLKYILEDQLGNPLLITWKKTIGLDLTDSKCHILSPDLVISARSESEASPSPCHEVAYCFFTSGSTGRPKGVLVKHSSYVNVVHWQINACNLTASDRSSVVCSPAFDVSLLDIWPPLCSGGCLYIPRNHYRYDTNLLADWIREQCITICALPTAVGSRILATEEKCRGFKALRWMLVGGEALIKYPSPDLPFRVINLYGPTETAVLATWIDLHADQKRKEELPPIGKPINDQVRVYLLDQNDTTLVTEPGRIGEICIAGIGVAKGYLNQPQLTAEKFIPNPHYNGADPTFSTIYKSGDMGYWNSEGNLCYVGRSDNQIKFHGFRIELGNIEQALAAVPGIEQAIVLLEEENEKKALVAYCLVQEFGEFEEKIAQLQTNLYPSLRSNLGHYEIPSQIYILPPTLTFPLTTAGKIDRRQLHTLKSETVLIKSTHEPLETEYEIMVAQTWSELLCIPFSPIGRSDNFFALGGTSIIALQMLHKLQCMIDDKCLKITGIHLHNIFRAQTVYELGKLIGDNIVSDKHKHAENGNSSGMISLSKSQELIWTQMRKVPAADWHQFNQAVALKFRCIPDMALLHAALIKVIQRHDILSYTFQFDGNSSHFALSEAPDLEMIDLTASTDSWTESTRILNKNSSKTLANGDHLIKFRVLKVDGLGNYDAHIVAQQLALDVTSFNIIIWELQQLIRSALGHEVIATEEDLQMKPKYRYSDFVDWQQQFEQTDHFKNLLNVWRLYLQDWTPLPSLSIREKSVDLNSDTPYAGVVLPFRLDSSLTKNLEDYSKEKHTTVYNLLVTAFKILLHLYSGNKCSDISILSIVLGRDQLEFNESVGHFTNPVAIRTRGLCGSLSFEYLVQLVHANSMAVYEHAEFPFQFVVDNMDADPRKLFNFCINMTPRSPTHLTSTRNLFQTYESDLTSQKIMLTFEEVKEDTNHIDGFLELNSNLFSQDQLKHFVKHFKTVLEKGISNPSISIDRLFI